MKKSFIFLVVFLLLLNFIPVAIATTCNADMEVYTYLDVFAGDNLAQRGAHKFPDFKEDDTLFINSILIKNNAPCNSTKYNLKFGIKKPDNIAYYDSFCSYTIFTIPELENNKTYLIYFLNVTKEFRENEPIIQKLEYKDFMNKSFNLCPVKLIKAGEWKINTDLIPVTGVKIGVMKTYFVDKDNFARDGFFKVHPKLEIEILDLTSKTTNLNSSIEFFTRLLIVLGLLTLSY